MDIFLQLLDLTIRSSVPILLACLAGLYSERSGIFDIGLEGKMLSAAFASGVGAALTHSAWIGLFCGMFASMSLALIHGFASITNRGNQIVSGVAINFIAAGGSVLLGNSWFGSGGRTPSLPLEARFTPIDLPFVDLLSSIPILGSIYSDLLSGHNIISYFAFLSVPLTWWILFRTRFGLHLRAVGENPEAVESAGISVSFIRYRAVLLCGFLCSLAGAYLAIGVSAGFVRDMTAGRGFIALAALIFAKWRPIEAMFACLLFGFLGALEIRYQDFSLPFIGLEFPVQLMQALPYILVVVLLAGFVGRSVPPKAGGIPYEKER